jgi:predicted nuclease of predicted toxin-antitoxin system
LSLLLDENLSPRLIPRLTLLFPGLTHVRDVDLKQADDRTIWDWARQNSYTLVTADSDFVAWSARLVAAQVGSYRAVPFRVIKELLRQNHWVSTGQKRPQRRLPGSIAQAETV